MAYLDVIPLADAKLYLRVDDTLTEDDSSITRMINAALEYVENWTNVLVFSRDKTYLMVDGYIRVYDGPITAIVSPLVADGLVVERKTLHNIYCYGVETSDLVLTVGHTVLAEIPQDLIEVAYEIIDLMYYEHETGKTVKKDLSGLSIDILNKHKRFIM